jgi:hypothetical protein
MSAASSLQLSGVDDKGQRILSVLAKRQYRISDSGRAIDPEDSPLRREPAFSSDTSELMDHDVDVFPFKPLTDVVIAGSAHPPRVCRRFIARVSVGGLEKRLAVFGARQVSSIGEFMEPAEAEPTPLGYDDAFGGEDRAYLAKKGHPLDPIRRELEEERPEMYAENPHAYPRNPSGRGFSIEGVVDPAIELPRFEDPNDLLTPERLRASAGFQWAQLPIQAGLGWYGHLWFPRSLYFGFVPEVRDPSTMPEVKAGAISKESLIGGPKFQEGDPRFACGASPGLSVPYLLGGEAIMLENLSSSAKRREVHLPAAPIMRADGRKRGLVEASPVLHTVFIEPDEDRITVVWRGSIAAIRPYLDEELERMPFEVVW